MIARIWHGYTKPEHADATILLTALSVSNSLRLVVAY
jgi:hypothetical protein